MLLGRSPWRCCWKGRVREMRDHHAVAQGRRELRHRWPRLTCPASASNQRLQTNGLPYRQRTFETLPPSRRAARACHQEIEKRDILPPERHALIMPAACATHVSAIVIVEQSPETEMLHDARSCGWQIRLWPCVFLPGHFRSRLATFRQTCQSEASFPPYRNRKPLFANRDTFSICLCPDPVV
jgi:hypothetical protein